MTTNVVGVVRGVLLLMLTFSVALSWRIDCRKFVFAPKCRGVAAKRSLASALDSRTNHLFDTFVMPSDSAGWPSQKSALYDPKLMHHLQLLGLEKRMSPAHISSITRLKQRLNDVNEAEEKRQNEVNLSEDEMDDFIDSLLVLSGQATSSDDKE